jgi:hypothetical protein
MPDRPKRAVRVGDQVRFHGVETPYKGQTIIIPIAASDPEYTGTVTKLLNGSVAVLLPLPDGREVTVPITDRLEILNP